MVDSDVMEKEDAGANEDVFSNAHHMVTGVFLNWIHDNEAPLRMESQ